MGSKKEVDIKEKWLTDSKKALEKMMVMGSGSVFDAHLFPADLFVSVCNDMPVKTEKNSCKYFNRIRASRLKFLGYSWDLESGYWVKP